MTNNTNFLVLESKIVDVLKTIFDPEIPVNIYELGLIYEIKVDQQHVAHIKMTVTSPNCPVAETLPNEVKDAVNKIEELNDVNIVLTFDPPWQQDMMSEAAKLELGFL